MQGVEIFARWNSLPVSELQMQQRIQGGPRARAPPCPQEFLFIKSCSLKVILRGKPLFWFHFGLRAPAPWGQNTAGPPWPKSWIRAWDGLSAVKENAGGQHFGVMWPQHTMRVVWPLDCLIQESQGAEVQGSTLTRWHQPRSPGLSF